MRILVVSPQFQHNASPMRRIPFTALPFVICMPRSCGAKPAAAHSWWRWGSCIFTRCLTSSQLAVGLRPSHLLAFSRATASSALLRSCHPVAVCQPRQLTVITITNSLALLIKVDQQAHSRLKHTRQHPATQAGYMPSEDCPRFVCVVMPVTLEGKQNDTCRGRVLDRASYLHK